MDIARQETGIARVGDVIYVVGGLVAGAVQPTDVVEAYDLASASWSAVTTMPVALHHVACAALDGKIYVVGGYRGGFSPEEETFVYDPVANDWTPGPDLPERRGAAWMVEHGGRLYHFGGIGPAGTTATTFVFDPATGWSEAMPMPTPREHTNAVVLGDFIYVIGGRAGASTDANERYDPAMNVWAPRASMPTARSAMAMAALGGKIYCMGGEVPQLFAVNEVYDPVSNAWDCRESMAIPRHGVAAIALADRIFVPAGGIVQGLDPTNEVDSFVPDDLVPVEEPGGEPFISSSLRLAPAAPNPFASTTVFRFALARASHVTLTVYDAAGRLVRRVLNHAPREAGEHRAEWDGFDRSGTPVAPGVYLCRLSSEAGGVHARRVIRLR